MGALLLPFDAETTGMVDWKKPSGGDDQPHIVQLAASLVDEDTRDIVQSMNVIVQPNGWEISQEMTDIHGISHEQAMDVGIPEPMALDMFLALWNGRTRIAHNTTFDNRIIRIATKRYSDEQTIDRWKEGSQGEEWVCTMLKARKVMGGKQPTLAEAYKHFTGKDLENAHTAWDDMLGCMDVYWAIQDSQQSKVA